MFTGPISPRRYFFYSAGLLILELALSFLAMVLMWSFASLSSDPGEEKRTVMSVVVLIFVLTTILRANFAWRRGTDAGGMRISVCAYIFMNVLSLLLQSVIILSPSGVGGDATAELGMLGLTLLCLWVRLLTRPSVSSWGGGDAFLIREGYLSPPLQAPAEPVHPVRNVPAPKVSRPSPAPTPVVTRSRPAPTGFGRRGS